MDFNSGLQVNMPVHGVVISKQGVYPTVYMTVGPGYLNKRGALKHKRVAIGKLDPSTGKLMPNDVYWKNFSHAEALRMVSPYDSVRKVGEGFLVGGVMSRLGLVGILDEVLGKARSRRLRTAALFMALRGNVLDTMEDFCETHTLPESPLASQAASKLFTTITYDERTAFLKKWMAKLPVRSRMTYVATSHSTHAREILDAECGLGNDGERLPQMNFSCCVSEDSGLPCSYVSSSEPMEGVSLLKHALSRDDELGMPKSAGFVLGEGFCSLANVDWLIKNGHDFVLGVGKEHEMTKAAISLARQSIESVEHRISPGLFGMAGKGSFYGSRMTMHIFYERSLGGFQIGSMLARIDEEEKLLGRLERLTEEEAKLHGAFFSIKMEPDGAFSFKRDLEKIEQARQKCGFFFLLTNTNLGSAEVLKRYRRKGAIEKSFDDVKALESSKRWQERNHAVADGKMFCAFIALIAASEMGWKLGKLMRKKNLGLKGLMKRMEAMCVGMSDNGWRLLSPPTKKQRAIMEAMGLDEDDLRAYLNGKLELDS